MTKKIHVNNSEYIVLFGRIPARLRRWLDEHSSMIRAVSVGGIPAYDILLEPGFCKAEGGHVITGTTLSHTLEQLRSVGVCLCNHCQHDDPSAIDPVKTYLSVIGRRGGSKTSEAKTRANTANALKRWANRPKGKTRKKKEQTNG